MLVRLDGFKIWSSLLHFLFVLDLNPFKIFYNCLQPRSPPCVSQTNLWRSFLPTWILYRSSQWNLLQQEGPYSCRLMCLVWLPFATQLITIAILSSTAKERTAKPSPKRFVAFRTHHSLLCVANTTVLSPAVLPNTAHNFLPFPLTCLPFWNLIIVKACIEFCLCCTAHWIWS